MFCAKLVDLCKTCKVNTVEPLQEVMFDPTKHATFESESAGKDSFTFRYVVTPSPNLSFPGPAARVRTRVSSLAPAS